MTPPERKLWKVLRGEQLGVKFSRQHPIGPYIADFYSREAQLVVEIDGVAAHSGAEAFEYDRARDTYMESLGLRVMRIPASEVEHNLEGVAFIKNLRHEFEYYVKHGRSMYADNPESQAISPQKATSGTTRCGMSTPSGECGSRGANKACDQPQKGAPAKRYACRGRPPCLPF